MRDQTPADCGVLDLRSWAELEAAGALPPYIAEHAARPARYQPTEQDPETWPWCRHWGFKDGQKTDCAPHDSHMDNGGNTWCPRARHPSADAAR